MSNAYQRFVRAILVIVGGIAVGVGLRLIVWEAPATRTLVRPVYWVLAAIVAILIWRVTRNRAQRDRRHGERRHE